MRVNQTTSRRPNRTGQAVKLTKIRTLRHTDPNPSALEHCFKHFFSPLADFDTFAWVNIFAQICLCTIERAVCVCTGILIVSICASSQVPCRPRVGAGVCFNYLPCPACLMIDVFGGHYDSVSSFLATHRINSLKSRHLIKL